MKHWSSMSIKHNMEKFIFCKPPKIKLRNKSRGSKSWKLFWNFSNGQADAWGYICQLTPKIVKVNLIFYQVFYTPQKYNQCFN